MGNSAALLGALVADAASMGLHWLYDPARIAKVAQTQGTVAFCPNDPAHFDGAKGYYAHSLRRDGQFTQYGEAAYLAAQTIATHGRFDLALHQAAFAAHFGAGGTYQGYIDRPTKGTLANIANDQLSPSGIDDDQHPALATLPAMVASGQTNISDAMEVTNVNAVAAEYVALLSASLQSCIDGADLIGVLETAAKGNPLLQAALETRKQIQWLTVRSPIEPAICPKAYRLRFTS